MPTPIGERVRVEILPADQEKRRLLQKVKDIVEGKTVELATPPTTS